MKIAILSGNPYGPDYGGVLTHVKYLHQKLAKLPEIKLYHLTFGSKNITYEKNNVTYIEIKRMRWSKILFPFELLYDSHRLINHLKDINPDLTHIQSSIPLFSLVGLLIEKKYNELMTIHGYIREEYKTHQGFKKIINMIFGLPLEKLALSKVPYIIALTPQMKRLLQKQTESKIFQIPNGIDMNYIYTIKSRRLSQHPSIFFLGMLTKGKGLTDLINAFAQVHKCMSNLMLLIGGSGPYEDELKKLVTKYHLDQHVKFLGFLDEEKKFSYMKSIDLFVLPSHWESFPIVILEAMACGKPIIATDVGGISYAVTNGANGYLYQSGNVDELTSKIITLLNDDKTRKQMGQFNLKKSLEFDWDYIAEETKNVYHEIVKH